MISAGTRQRCRDGSGYFVETRGAQGAPNVRSRVPIPNVCQAMGLSWTDTFDMLRSFGVQLTWSPSAPPGR